jgi:hypothetical protein
LLVSFVASSGLVIAMTAAPGHAVSPSEENCTQNGGIWDRQQGEVSCTFVTEDPVGQSEHSGGQSQSTTTNDTDSSNGTLQNEPQHKDSSTCFGPGGSGEGGGPCP